VLLSGLYFFTRREGGGTRPHETGEKYHLQGNEKKLSEKKWCDHRLPHPQQRSVRERKEKGKSTENRDFYPG